MKRNISLLFFSLLMGMNCLFSQALRDETKIGSNLLNRMAEHPDEKQPIWIVLTDKVDIEAMDAEFYARKASLKERTYTVITTLQQKAASTQGPLIAFLKSRKEISAEEIRPFWITNLIMVNASPETIDLLSLRNDVESLTWDSPVYLEPFRVNSVETPGMRTPGGTESGLRAIKAPFMWGLGYTGNGQIVMSIDTGVDPDHPAIDNQYRGNFVPASQAWHDPGGNTTIPSDCDQHGTHTVGTMVGLDESTQDTIGVAFGASWIASPGICTNGDRISAFQWSLNPDNNVNTTNDMPGAINNSWYDPNLTDECLPTNAYKLVLDACEAAGIAVVFSAGNEGPGVSTITMPKNISTSLVNVFCVGNLNGNLATLPIASSSSRGPSDCGGTGSLLIKPEVSAPGTDVRSCIPGAGYANFTGTSMAAPHVCGAIMLLREAFPTITGTEVKLALYYSCTDLGAAGEDNNYGMGIINLEGAYNYLIQQGFVPYVPANNYNASVLSIGNIQAASCNNSINPAILVKNNGDSVITSMNIHYSLNTGFSDTLVWTGTLLQGNQTAVPVPAIAVTPNSYTLTVEIKYVNGLPDDKPIDNAIGQDFLILNSQPVSVSSTNICTGNTATLTGTPPNGQGTVVWYNSLTSTSPVATGNSFNTPVLTASTTYYADAIQTAQTGKLDTTGGGGNHTNDAHYLIFDALAPFTLKSVEVFSYTAGQRTIQVRDQNGAVLDEVTVNIPTGMQTVTLNLNVPIGNNLQLGVSGLSDMFRNNSGPSYPYTVNGIVNIKTSSATTNPGDFYYYFFKWQIEWSNPCGRVPATVNVGQGLNATASASSTVVDLATSGQVNFTSSGTGVNAWNWAFGDGGVSTLQNPTHTYTTTGNYQVQVTATDNFTCEDTDTLNVNVINTTDITDGISGIGIFRLVPNPSNGLFSLELTLNEKQNAAIEITDVLGRILYCIPATSYYKDIIPLDLQMYPSGVYWIRIHLGKKEIALKAIKE
ncbi:MAG: S8 family serine peptidase [Bacteroidia bacterium]|nr:S8 family serine peptidase [Bacteroidia bacterium]